MNSVTCPHCRKPISMTETDRYTRHVTYWGERAPVADECPSCDAEIYIHERVNRDWIVGRTPDEASEL